MSGTSSHPTVPASDVTTSMQFRRADLPQNFCFGAATAAYQIEGQSFGGAGPCHWDSFAATEGNVLRGEDGAIACDHYHRFEADLDLVKNCNLDAYRFSTNWSRVLPDGKGQVNAEGLDFYDRLVDAMLERDLDPFCTLYHWELPQAMSDIGGWRNADVTKYFADFAEIIGKHLGDRLSHIATINEPWCVSYLSHFEGHHAPGLRDIRATARSMHYILLAHGRAMSALRALGLSNLGIVLNLEWCEPKDQEATQGPEMQNTLAMANAVHNDWFLGGIFKGAYPDIMLDGLNTHMPRGWQDDMPIISQNMDWLGINYYKRSLFSPNTGMWPHFDTSSGTLPKTQMGWEIYPQGLYETLKRTAELYSKDLPIFITENGMANDDIVLNGAVADHIRLDYLNDHILAVAKAAEDGVPMAGYFAWSLLDNYEWAFGYERRFGLVHVDFETQKRTPKASYHALKAALS